MDKFRLYIIQFFGVLVLLCGYLITNRPDSESVMHFVHNPATPYTLSNAPKSDPTGAGATYSSNSSNERSSRKFHLGKRIVYQVVLPVKHTLVNHFITFSPVTYTPALPENYNYLYFREINPPPPKGC